MGFFAFKHIQFLQDLERVRFSGQMVLTAPAGQQWTLYLSQGRILYATGGVHPGRRWRRNLMRYCPQRPSYRLAWQQDLPSAKVTALNIAWDFALLCLWLEREAITHEQLGKVVSAIVTEVLFDLAQAGDISHKIVQQDLCFPELASIAVSDAITQFQQLWQVWQSAKLTNSSPDQAPIIRQLAPLREHTSPEVCRTMIRWLTGQHTLRDLTVPLQRDVAAVLMSLQPFVQAEWVELVSIADLPAPALPQTRIKLPSLPSTQPIPQKVLVACVDDSSSVRYTMENLLASAGYEFLGLDDPLRAISVLLARKPDFIFLDLMMPKVNGCEVCEQLRKLPCFRTTPIVILTGSDGYANRLKSNFAGASAFLTKPLNGDVVLGTIRKHLTPNTASLSVATYDKGMR